MAAIEYEKPHLPAPDEELRALRFTSLGKSAEIDLLRSENAKLRREINTLRNTIDRLLKTEPTEISG